MGSSVMPLVRGRFVQPRGQRGGHRMPTEAAVRFVAGARPSQGTVTHEQLRREHVRVGHLGPEVLVVVLENPHGAVLGRGRTVDVGVRRRQAQERLLVPCSGEVTVSAGDVGSRLAAAARETTRGRRDRL